MLSAVSSVMGIMPIMFAITMTEIFILLTVIMIVPFVCIMIPPRMILMPLQLRSMSVLAVIRNINIVIPMFTDKIDRPVTGTVLDAETPPVFDMLTRSMQI
ncbi:MAG: hypothetical protein KF888_08960 [Nitrosomonas sp.]|nr:hypothetical protein [Nitrosomonas sp.]